MSVIQLEDINLVFKVWKEKRIKDIIIPGSNKFNDYEIDGTVHAIKNMS